MISTHRIALFAVLMGLACSSPAWVSDALGEVTEVRAQIVSTSTEFVDGQAGSTDASVEDFPLTSNQLPIESFSGLGNFEGAEDGDFGARGIATFRDPSLSPSANPGEWGVEADCYSLEPGVSYEVASEITEQRDIVFTAADLGVASDAEPADVAVVGNVFANGGILIWSDDPARDLTGLRVELDIKVAQVGGSSATAGDELYEGSLIVSGGANSSISVSSTGGLFAITDGPVLLIASNLPGISDVVGELQANGDVHLVVLPEQSLGYGYQAQAEDPLTLEAKTSVRAVNLPDGTGVAAVFGRPFRALTSVVAPFVPKESAELTQTAMNRTIAESATPQTQNPTTSRGCGAIGLCVPILLVCGLAASRRRW